MKKVIFALCCLTLTASAVVAQEKKSPAEVAAPAKDAGVFKFKEADNTHDFGTIPEGPTGEYDFQFKNVGKSPIIIQEAHGSCGCTVPQWPKEPILPGKKAKIHVTYNTDHRPGPIDKTVTITSNASEQQVVLHIKGTVKPKPTETKPAEVNPPMEKGK